MSLRIEKVVTSGTFSLDGQTFDVDNNVWLLGDDAEVIVIDAAHDAGAIAAAVGERRAPLIVATHAHDDHIDAAPQLSSLLAAPVALHPADLELWHMTHAEPPDQALADGDELVVAGAAVRVLHTPGHSPGGVSLHVADLGVVFTGDTLFNGGPGATGRSFSDFPTIVESIRTKLLVLPPGTVVHTGHGDDTTIGDEAPHVQEWLDRGH